MSVERAGSSDPDGDALTYAWDFGDGAVANGVTTSHTYSAAGTYDIKLTVGDGHGGTANKTISFTAGTTDPDPNTKTIVSGQTVWISLSDSALQRYFKILVPTGASQLQAVTGGPACSGGSCPVDAELYTRQSSRPTNAVYACHSNTLGNAETCTTANPAAAYWYLRVKRTSGTGKVKLTVTLT